MNKVPTSSVRENKMTGIFINKNHNRSGIYLFALILNAFVLRIGGKNKVCWDSNVVPYNISPGFTPDQHDYIKQQIAKINTKTCVLWSDMTETNNNLQNVTSFVRFQKATSWFGPCQTILLLPSDEQRLGVEITLADVCFKERNVLHEIIHALGFVHEQMRIDRDCYVWLSERAKKDFNYAVYPEFYIPNLDRFPYDKKSIMHYKRTSAMKSLSERWYEWEPLGNDGESLTELDLWKIQYRFCGRPHYCDVYPQHCKYMEQLESEMNCNVSPTGR